MLTVADIEPHIESEFGSQLEPFGFQRIGRRKWIRVQKLPVREIFVISALKGGRFSPAWGLSSGFVPSFRGRFFRRQSSEKNALMDLVIDPIDIAGDVPPQAFGFITGYDTQIPTIQIRACAEHFVPVARADFDRVRSIHDFCQFFLERSRLHYRRFLFHNYVQHQLVHGFVLIFMGQRDEGMEKLRQFCDSVEAEFEDRILSECVRNAESLAGQQP